MSRGLILVTGATGAVGPAVVRALRDAGWDVRALLRSEAPHDLQHDAECFRGDLRDFASLTRAVEGVDAVVHMAGLLHLVGAGKERDADFRALNVDATRALVDAARGRPIVFFSSIAVYGSGGPFDESSPVRPENTYASTKVEAERLVLDANGTVLRIAAVYGPRLKGNYATLVQALRRGFFLPLGHGENHRTLVRDVDVAQAVVRVLTSDRATGKVYNVTDGTTHRLHDIIAAISAGLGKHPPRISVPAVLVRVASGIGPLGTRLAKYSEDIRVDGSKIQRELGYRPAFSLYDGWADALRGGR